MYLLRTYSYLLYRILSAYSNNYWNTERGVKVGLCDLNILFSPCTMVKYIYIWICYIFLVNSTFTIMRWSFWYLVIIVILESFFSNRKTATSVSFSSLFARCIFSNHFAFNHSISLCLNVGLLKSYNWVLKPSLTNFVFGTLCPITYYMIPGIFC